MLNKLTISKSFRPHPTASAAFVCISLFGPVSQAPSPSNVVEKESLRELGDLPKV